MPEGPRRIVLHAGFHRTGTTSAQKTLRLNGSALWPRMALELPHRMTEVCSAALPHTVQRDSLSMAATALANDAYLASLVLRGRHQLNRCE